MVFEIAFTFSWRESFNTKDKRLLIRDYISEKAHITFYISLLFDALSYAGKKIVPITYQEKRKQTYPTHRLKVNSSAIFDEYSIRMIFSIFTTKKEAFTKKHAFPLTYSKLMDEQRFTFLQMQKLQLTTVRMFSRKLSWISKGTPDYCFKKKSSGYEVIILFSFC